MANVRERIYTLMHETLADERRRHDWSYEAVRPMPVPDHWHKGKHIRGDCGKGYQYLVHWAGGPDPMGMRFGPYGNSASVTHHLPHRHSLNDMEIGDAVTFGPYGDEHTTGVMRLIRNERGHVVDLELWSFGGPGTPNSYKLSQERRKHYLLKLPVGEFKARTTAELRLLTGFWAWRQWKDGVGDWHGHGKANKHLRPDVPRIIPLAWWRHYWRLHRRRKLGDKATVPVAEGG